jgi:hypothetical protein
MSAVSLCDVAAAPIFAEDAAEWLLAVLILASRQGTKAASGKKDILLANA